MVQELEPSINVEKLFYDFFTNTFGGKTPNAYHDVIVNTKYPCIVTTNYDSLLEDAAYRNGFRKLNASTFGFKKPEKLAAALYQANPVIIHAHGELRDLAVDDFILTAEDYVAIERNYAGFVLALQTVFIKYSVLFVGYGGSDPHFEDFMEELSYLFKWSTLTDLPKYFIVLKKDKAGHVLDHFKEKLRTSIITIDDYPDTLRLLRALQTIPPRPKETRRR